MHDPRLALIIGLVLGIAVLNILLGSLWWYLRRRSTRLNSIIKNRKGREESQPTEHVSITMLPEHHHYHNHNVSSPSEMTKSSFSVLKDGNMSRMTRSRSYSYSTQLMDRTAGMNTATDGVLRRNISTRSQDTASIYSTASIEPRVFNEGRLYTTRSQELCPSSNEISTAFQSQHPLTHLQPRAQSTMALGQDGASFRRDSVSRTGYVGQKHHEPQSLRQNLQEIQQIRYIKEELAPETYVKPAWRRMPSSSSTANMVRCTTSAVNTQIGMSQVDRDVNPSGSIQVAGGTIIKINETTYQSPPPNYSILVSNYRPKSTSILSLIPQGPLSYNNIKSFLATPQNTISTSTKKSAFPFGAGGDNQNRSDQPYLHTLTPASEVTPIVTRAPTPFSPLFVNEPARFSPATILTSRAVPSRNLKRVG